MKENHVFLEKSFVFEAPAKLNWFLDILYKREDSYHELSTLMQKVSIADRFYLSFPRKKEFAVLVQKEKDREKIEVNTKDKNNDKEHSFPGEPTLERHVRVVRMGNRKILYAIESKEGLCPGRKNTVLLALEQYLSANEAFEKIFPEYTYIELKKSIPIQGGMGGGSANAAAILRFCNFLSEKYCQESLPEEKMQSLALAVGADVPFLLNEANLAYCRGVGEIIEERETKIEYPLLFLFPNIQVSTKEAFQKFTLYKEQIASSDAEAFYSALAKGHYDNLKDLGQNTFYHLMKEEIPELVTIQNLLEESGAIYARMSGSGASFFGLYHDRDEREKAREFLLRYLQENPDTALRYKLVEAEAIASEQSFGEISSIDTSADWEV